MPRLHTLYLPNGRRSTPFAFILDQTTPMTEAAIAAWQAFAEKCGALDIMFTAETIDIDPETSDGWQPEDDEPVAYAPAGCEGHPLPAFVSDLIDAVREAHAAAWVPWESANLDPESPRVMTHREDACPSLNDGMTGCPMHDPILEGGWVTWPYFATQQGIITRICEHGITHPTPEEYLGGFDTPHLCDGCPCAPVADFSIVVSDLANTKLPRGTLLLGVKDDSAPDTTPPAPAAAEVTPDEWFSAPITHEGDVVGNAELHPDGRVRGTLGATTSGETLAEALAKGPLSGDWGPPSMPAMDAVRANIEDAFRSGLVAPADPSLYPTMPEIPGADAEPGSVRRGGVTFPVRVQPLGADGEPVGEAGVYDLPGPVRVTEIHEKHGDPILTEEAFEPFGSSPVGPDEVRLCVAASNGARCTREYRHDGLHEFGPFTRV